LTRAKHEAVEICPALINPAILYYNVENLQQLELKFQLALSIDTKWIFLISRNPILVMKLSHVA
jgi:hypothetical protein